MTEAGVVKNIKAVSYIGDAVQAQVNLSRLAAMRKEQAEQMKLDLARLTDEEETALQESIRAREDDSEIDELNVVSQMHRRALLHCLVGCTLLVSRYLPCRRRAESPVFFRPACANPRTV